MTDHTERPRSRLPEASAGGRHRASREDVWRR